MSVKTRNKLTTKMICHIRIFHNILLRKRTYFRGIAPCCFLRRGQSGIQTFICLLKIHKLLVRSLSLLASFLFSFCSLQFLINVWLLIRRLRLTLKINSHEPIRVTARPTKNKLVLNNLTTEYFKAKTLVAN